MGADLVSAGAVSGAGAPGTLDVDLAQVFLDQRLLDQLVRAIQLDRGGSYVEALDALHAGAELAQGSPSLRDALECADADPDYVESSLKILEALDVAAEKAHERAARRAARERVDGLGRVRLDGDAQAPMSRDQRERRLARARAAAPRQVDGDEGRARFFELDRQHLAVGLDVVRTVERPAEIRTMRCNPAAIAAQLVQSIAATGEKLHKLELLQAMVEELRGAVVDIDDTRTVAAGGARTRRAAVSAAKPGPGRRSEGRQLARAGRADSQAA